MPAKSPRSRSAKAKIPTQPAFSIALGSDDDILAARWTEHVPYPVLRAHFEELLAAAKQHDCRFWLLDLRQRDWPEPVFMQWEGDGYAAEVARVIGQPVFVAYMLDGRSYAHTTGVVVEATLRAATTHDYHPHYFEEEVDARAWLELQQDEDPAPGEGPAE